MSLKPLTSIKGADFEFENATVRVVAVRSCPEVGLAGLEIGPFEEGREYEVRFWVARELEKAGIARFREEERLDSVMLYKIHWKERVQPLKRVSSLPENFYPKLRRYLADLKSEAARSAEKMREYEKVVKLSNDVISTRLNKIVSLSASPVEVNEVLQSLALEERILYDRLHEIISEWRSHILTGGSMP
ncbi:MAG: hypothetical protein QW231_05985 [Candidatus Bathyarchaeia archaeon]